VVAQELAQQQPEPVRELQPARRPREPERQPPERWEPPPGPLNSLVQPRERSSQERPQVQASPREPVQAWNSCIRPTLWSP